MAAGLPPELKIGAKRSKLSWYNIDQIFYGSSLRPQNIDSEELSRAEVRQVNYNELFPEVDLDVTQSSIIRTLDLAYFPAERGTYSYDDSFGSDNKYLNPEDRWAGITRALTTTNFQQANIEYVQFWLLDPYENYSIKPEEGRSFNSAKLFRICRVNCILILVVFQKTYSKMTVKCLKMDCPLDGVQIPGQNVEITPWSSIPTDQSLLYAFPESDEARIKPRPGS